MDKIAGGIVAYTAGVLLVRYLVRPPHSWRGQPWEMALMWPASALIGFLALMALAIPALLFLATAAALWLAGLVSWPPELRDMHAEH